jgi:hypothetical protein
LNIPPDADYERKKKLATDRLWSWGDYTRARETPAGQTTSSMMYRLQAEEAESKRRTKKVPQAWSCKTCLCYYFGKRPTTCGHCNHKTFHKLKYQAGKEVYAALIRSTSPGRDWSEEIETDRLVRALPYSLRRIIEMIYSRNMTVKDGAWKLRISEFTFKIRNNLALHFLMGAMRYGTNGI